MHLTDARLFLEAGGAAGLGMATHGMFGFKGLHLLLPIPLFFLVCCFFRETVVRLQSENKMLCVQEENYRQKLVEVQAQLEGAQRSRNTLETQDR